MQAQWACGLERQLPCSLASAGDMGLYISGTKRAISGLMVDFWGNPQRLR